MSDTNVRTAAKADDITLLEIVRRAQRQAARECTALYDQDARARRRTDPLVQAALDAKTIASRRLEAESLNTILGKQFSDSKQVDARNRLRSLLDREEAYRMGLTFQVLR